jgi:hypothetical protein
VKLAIIALLSCLVLSAQDVEATVETKYGDLVLSDIRMAGGPQVCQFKATISNPSIVVWSNVLIELTVIGREGSTADARGRAERIRDDSVGLISGVCHRPERFEPKSATARMLSGTPDESGVAEFKRQQRAEAATVARKADADKKAAAAAAVRTAELAKLPLLNSGTPAAFLGSDRKCAQQLQEALAMDGLEKRKRIADLVSYGCGVLVDSPVRATAGQRDGAYVFVTLADGKRAGKTGWVPIAWLK